MYLLFTIVLCQVIFSANGLILKPCLDGYYDDDGNWQGSKDLFMVEDETCDCFGHVCEIGYTCVISKHDVLGKFSGKGWCLSDAGMDVHNPCPMTPVFGAPEGTAWPYITGKNKWTDQKRTESRQFCNCDNKWFCREGFEICSEFLGCIPRFDVVMDGRKMVRAQSEGFTQWMIYENPDAIVAETLRSNFEQYGDNVEIYNNRNISAYDRFKFFDMAQATCDAIGINENDHPKAWYTTDTPRNPEPQKVAIPKNNVVQSVKFGSTYKEINGHNYKIDDRKLSEINKAQKKDDRNHLFVDFVQVKWRCTDFDYAENSFGSGAITKDNELAWSETGGYSKRGSLNHATQMSRANKDTKHFPKYTYSPCYYWRDGMCDTRFDAAKPVNKCVDCKYSKDQNYAKYVEKIATTGSEHGIFIYPILEEGHGPNEVYGLPDIVKTNPVRDVYSDGYTGKAFVVREVKGCDKAPQNTADVFGEPLNPPIRGTTCYDYLYIYGDPKAYKNKFNKDVFVDKNQPFWVIAFRKDSKGAVLKPTRLSEIPKEYVVVSHNLKTMSGGKELEANSCRLGPAPTDKVYSNNQWSKAVADWTSDYNIRRQCNTIFNDNSAKSCFGLCNERTLPGNFWSSIVGINELLKEIGENIKPRSGHGYWRHILDRLKWEKKCMGWRVGDGVGYGTPSSRWTPWKVGENGDTVNKIDGGVTSSVYVKYDWDDATDWAGNKVWTIDTQYHYEQTFQGYIDIWKKIDPGTKPLLMYSPMKMNGRISTSQYSSDNNWAHKKATGDVFGFPHYGMSTSAGKRLQGCDLEPKRYSECETVRWQIADNEEEHWNDGYWPHESWEYDSRPVCADPSWAKKECKDVNNHYLAKASTSRPKSIRKAYLFDDATRFQFDKGATIFVNYHWQSFTVTYNLNTGTIAPNLNPFVNFNRMFEDIPDKKKRCLFDSVHGKWKNSEKEHFFLMDGQTTRGVSSTSVDANALKSRDTWVIKNGMNTNRDQIVLKGSSIVFCQNNVSATEACLCGKRKCEKDQWCYYRHFTSEDWKGRSFDLVGYCEDREIVPCEDVDPNTDFLTAHKEMKPRTSDCVCGTRPMDGNDLNWDAENLAPRWVYEKNGPYITCNFDLNVFGQGNISLEVPILSPPCRSIFGVKANDKRCTCYATKEGYLTPEDADEHVHWSDFLEGQYCNRTQYDSKVETIAYAVVSQGYCETYDGGQWQVVKNPDQCLEGSNRIDDKTLTINPKVRFTRSKHDQPGCSWDKGGWFLLFNDRLPPVPNYENPSSPNYVMPCEDTYAEDPTRSGCICQLRGERCEAVHAQRALAPADFSTHDYCVCGQKKCSDGKFCYEKLSGCEDTNSFKCNLADDNMCWPDNAQRIMTKISVMRQRVYFVEKLETTPQMTSVCPEGADGQESNDYGIGRAATEQCICGDAFKVLPTLCDPGDYCHHRLNICYKEKQDLCPTNVFNTELDKCLCGLRKNRPAHLMNVYEELEEATEEPHDQAKFFDTVYCERGQFCVLRDYSDSLEPDANCLSAPLGKCPDYPQQIESLCDCSPKVKGAKGQYCFKGEIRDDLHPICKDMQVDPDIKKMTLTNCYCPTSSGARGTLLNEGDNKYCDFRNGALTCGQGSNYKCGTVKNIPNEECDTGLLIKSSDAPNGCQCHGKLQTVVCVTGEMCGMLEGGLPKCFNEFIETCDASLSCEESLARADRCFCDGVPTEPNSICTGAGIVKNPICDRYESPYDVTKQDIYFHKFNQLQIGTVQQTFVIEDTVYGEEYDPLAYPVANNVKNLKRDAPDWCDPLQAFDNPDHYDCLYLPTKADLISEVSVRIEWSTENTFLIPEQSSITLKTSIDNVNNELSNCQSYRVTVGANDFTTAWESSDAQSTILDSFECPSGFCFTRKNSEDTCTPSTSCIQPEYEACDLFGTSKRYFTWLKHSDVYEKDTDLEYEGYDDAYNDAFIVKDTEYIDSGIYTKNDLLDFSTEILMCILEDVATKSSETVHYMTDGTTAPHAFVFSFDGECNGGLELLMYEGNGDNPGTTSDGRRNMCAKACAEMKPSLSSTTWQKIDDDGVEVTGFIVMPSGRCWCEVPDSKTCTRNTASSYDRYDLLDPFYSWTEVELEDRRSSIDVPVLEDTEKLLSCVVGVFTADILQRKDPTPLETTLIHRRFMGGNPSMTHFNPTAIAVDVKAVAGADDNACFSLNNEENTGWMPIHLSFHRNPCNTILHRSNTYQLQHYVDQVDRIDKQNVQVVESKETCVFERVFESRAEIKEHLAYGSCKYLRPLPEGWWAPRLPKTNDLAHADPAEECARRCYHAYKSRAFTLKTSHGIPTWLTSHVGFESDGFTQRYAGSSFWDKFNTLQQSWQAIPKATRLDQCACAYDRCEDIIDELNIMPIFKTNSIDPCFETFFPNFFILQDSPEQQKLYFEKEFVRNNICQIGTASDRFSRFYYSSYSINEKPLTVMSPQVTNLKLHKLDADGHLASDNGGIVLQDVDFSKGWSAHLSYHYNYNIPKCAGDCDRDSHCAPGLKCFQRSYGESVPGCKQASNRYLDLCYDPNDYGKPELETIDILGFSEVQQDTQKYLAQICVKYVPWCPVITENTRIEDINENMFECSCFTEAKKEVWDPNNPFWVYDRHKIYKNEVKYCLQEPDTRKVIIHKKPCAAFNKTIDWSLDFSRSSLGDFQVENLQECYCGGDNGLYCKDTEFCMGDENERVCQSLNQLIEKDVPVRVIEEGKCSDMPGWEPVQDPLFCYAQRQLLLRPHGYEILSSKIVDEYSDYPDVSLFDDVKYARLGDLQDKHEPDELYYDLSFEAGCSLSYVSKVDEDTPFYTNAHLAPIRDPKSGEIVSISHRKYTGTWGDRCAIPGLAEWYLETSPERYSTAYYSCDHPAEVSIWEEFVVKQNAFGTTRALPKLHSSDVNRVLGLYTKFGNEDFEVGEKTLEVNTKKVENMQFSQIEDIPAEIYNIVYKQKKLCKLDRPLCSDVVAGNAYDSKYCINRDGNVVDAGALKIPSGVVNPRLIQSGTCAQHEFNSIESAEKCLARAAELNELNIEVYATFTGDGVTSSCASNGALPITTAEECKAAAEAMGLTFRNANNWGAERPQCLKWGNDVYFNIHVGTPESEKDRCGASSHANNAAYGLCICKNIQIVTETSVPTPYKPVSDESAAVEVQVPKQITITSASQSSNPYSQFPASHAFDGDVNTHTHTKYPGGTDYHWLELVLQSGTRHLSKVEITNRQNCCEGKLSDFRIEWQKNGQSSWETCGTYNYVTKEAKDFACDVNSDVDIRAVRIYKPYSGQASADNTLHVAEVKIYGYVTNINQYHKVFEGGYNQNHGGTPIYLYNEYTVFQKDNHFCRSVSSGGALAPVSSTTKIVSTNEECAKHCFSVFPSATRVFASWRAGHPVADKKCYCHKLDEIDHCTDKQWHKPSSGAAPYEAYTYHLLDMRKLSSKINSKQGVNDKCAEHCAGERGFITSFDSRECICSQTTPHFSLKHSDAGYETFSFGGPPKYRKIANGYASQYYPSGVSYSAFRLYAGCGISTSNGDTNTYPDGTSTCDADYDKRARECGNACLLRGSIEGHLIKGFLFDNRNGRCYCSVKRSYEGDIDISSTWDGYDFVGDKVHTSPSTCPDNFFFQNGVCTRLVSSYADKYCDGGAWGTGKFVFQDIDYGMDNIDCASQCSQYAIDNLLGTVNPGQILRHYASNRDYGSEQRCFCHELVYAGEGHCEDTANLESNTWYSTVVIDTVIPDTGDYTGISNQIANKRCAYQCTGEDGFAITNDGKCLCQRDGLSTSSYVEPGSFQRFEINPFLEYEENHVHYIKIGDGYCSDWKYLPEGGYPNFLSKSSPLFSTDRTRECMNRCLDAYPDSQAFYIRTSDNKCGCSSGQCQSTSGTATSYTSYKIVKCLGEWKAPKYSFKYQGSCKNFVTSVDECEYAAAQMNLPDKHIESKDIILSDHENINHPGLPYGCTQRPIGKFLYMNWNTNTKTCGTSGYPCICRDEPVTCPAGTYAYSSGSHCCRVNSDKNGQPLQYHHADCLDDNFIDCPAGAVDGACADEKNFCSIKNGNVDFVLNKQHLSVQLASNQVYKSELVNDLEKCATPAQKSVVAILSQDSGLTQEEKVANCRDSCIHGVEAKRDTLSFVQATVTGQKCLVDGINIIQSANQGGYDLDLCAEKCKWTDGFIWKSINNGCYCTTGQIEGCATQDNSWIQYRFIPNPIKQRINDDPRPTKPLMCMENWKGYYGRDKCAGATYSDGSWAWTYCTGGHSSAHSANDYFKTCCEWKNSACVEKEWRTETWQDMLESQYFSNYIGDGYCLPDAWNINKFVADFKTCEGRCAATPNCNVFAWIDANDDSRVSSSQCIINTDSTCLNSADGSNNYPWKRFKLMKRPSGKYYEIGEGLCSDSGGENIETEAECTEAAHYVKDAYCTKNGFENINGGGCRFSGYSYDRDDRPTGCFWYSDSQNELAWFNTNINSVEAGNGRKSICKKRVHGFVLEDDGKCTCTTGSTNQHKNYKPIRYKYRCKWMADPAGTVDSSNYVPFLASSDPLASTDRAQECANRCNADGYTHFMTNGNGRCKCAQDDCSEVVAQTDAISYEITTCGNFYEIQSETQTSGDLPSGCSVAGSQVTFNPFVNAFECDATNNCICEEEKFTVECPANEFPLDETKSLDFCRCNGEELCSSDYAPFCLTNGKCVKNGKCIHNERLLAVCEGKAGWLRHPVDDRENEICQEWFASDTEKTRPRGGVTACGVIRCPRGHTYNRDLNICSNYMENTFNTMAKLVSGTCSDVTTNVTRGHYDCQRYNNAQQADFLRFRNVEDVNAPYGCSATIQNMNEETTYHNGLYNVYDSRQLCSIKTPCFCQVENMPACTDDKVTDEPCLCGNTREIVLEGGMCKGKQAYPSCFNTDQSVRMTWPCVCADKLVAAKTYCNIVEGQSINMQFSVYGADFERRHSTCHFQDSDVYLHIPRTSSMDSEIVLMPNPNDRMSDILRHSGMRSAIHLTLKNIMHDLNDLAESIKYKAGEYQLGSKNHSFAGIYRDKGLFCKNKTCHFGIPGRYGAQKIISNFECRSVDYSFTHEVVNNVYDCAKACGRKKGCWVFAYNDDSKLCQLEKTGGPECTQGWTPANVDTYRVEYEYVENLIASNCTNGWGKTCMNNLEIVDVQNKIIRLGNENMDFKNPPMNVRGLYHTVDEPTKVTYFIGDTGTRSCSDDPSVICGIKTIL
jgi:hypothetical protein